MMASVGVAMMTGVAMSIALPPPIPIISGDARFLPRRLLLFGSWQLPPAVMMLRAVGMVPRGGAVATPCCGPGLKPGVRPWGSGTAVV